MGTEDAEGFLEDGEGPVREVQLSPFAIEAHAVTNRRFADFVDATGYTTDAERYGWSFVFAGLLPDSFPETRGVVDAPWWRQVFGATWRCPEGPQSAIEDRLDHPVVHVSWHDARPSAPGRSCGFRPRPSGSSPRAEGWSGSAFPWGDEREPGGEHRMNVWQGQFPTHNSGDDGYYGTCPVGEFPANGYGLHNMSGNVWEWCADWFHASYHRRASEQRDPNGPPGGDVKVTRGGSYLCHRSYCNRYRVGARGRNTPDSSTGNVGFRCARSIQRAEVWPWHRAGGSDSRPRGAGIADGRRRGF